MDGTNKYPADSTTKYAVNAAGYPLIPLNLRDHKKPIAITWTILLLFNCVIPLVLYFVLKYETTLSESIVLAIPTAIFGATSYFSFGMRTWRLTRPEATWRPIGGTKNQLDFFHWQFIIGFTYITALIVAGDVTKNVRIVSMPISLLMVHVCGLLVVGELFVATRTRYPFRVSSMTKGEMVRPALYTIVEDVVAVDGNCGLEFREAWSRRYVASYCIQSLLSRLGWLWGVTGLCVAGMNLALIWVMKGPNICFAIGWSVPWGWAAIMTITTFAMTKAALRAESRTKFSEAGQKA